MTNEPSPRPWRIESDSLTLRPPVCFVVDANGAKVSGGFFSRADAALIVDAVNERDRLRDQLAAALRHADECSRDAADAHAGRARAVEEAQSEANLRADRLADIARRLIGYCEAVTAYRPLDVEVRASDGTHEDYNGAELLREARAAIGEDEK